MPKINYGAYMASKGEFMSRIVKHEIALTEPEWEQLMAYIRWAGDSGCHYGDRGKFSIRDANIRRELRKKLSSNPASLTI